MYVCMWGMGRGGGGGGGGGGARGGGGVLTCFFFVCFFFLFLYNFLLFWYSVLAENSILTVYLSCTLSCSDTPGSLLSTMFQLFRRILIGNK